MKPRIIKSTGFKAVSRSMFYIKRYLEYITANQNAHSYPPPKYPSKAKFVESTYSMESGACKFNRKGDYCSCFLRNSRKFKNQLFWKKKFS